jgi:hypothetical protein
MAYDTIGLSARLAAVIDDDDGFRSLVSLRSAAAQSFVNLLQAVRSFSVC